MNCAKTAEPIEMLYGMWTCGSPGNHVLGGGPDPFICWGSFGGRTWARPDFAAVDILTVIR